MTSEVAEPSGRTLYPDALQVRDWWVNWVLAVRHEDMENGEPVDGATATKQPVAPYQNGDAEPARWNFGLDDDEHPSTEYDTVARWDGLRTGYDLPAPDRVLSEELGVGIIIPPQQGEEPITLLDWDDVRDPETDDVHPVCAEALRQCDGYAEISQSGEGIHQFIFGEIPGGFSKFLRHIDTEPFVGDDLPMVEMYASGRLTAMTGRHVDGTGTDVAEGQDMIDRLCREFGTGTNNSPGRTSDPFGRTTDDADDISHDDVGDELRASVEYDGDDPEQWAIPDGESVEYHAVLRARERSDELHNTANWELIGYAAAFGKRDGLDKADVLADLKAHPTPQYGFDRSRAQKEVRAVWRKMDNGSHRPPSRDTLATRGILPEHIADDSEEYDDDPRDVGATVDAERAWAAAGRVTPADLDGEPFDARDGGDAFACPCCGGSVDVVRAVAVDSGLVASCDASLTSEYPTAYNRAREEHGAPLPRYYTTADAVAEFSAVLDVIGELEFSHLDRDALNSTVTATGDDVSGEAELAIDPAWRDSESGESVLVFPSGVVWDADTSRSLDMLRFVAVDCGIIDGPTEDLSGERFTSAYRRARTEYGAPLPRWEPAQGGSRDVTPQLPPPADLLDDGRPEGVDGDALDDARDDVEDLIAEATGDDGTPTVVTAPPALGKTTGTVKTAKHRPLSYLAPRKELQADALDKAEKWGVDATILPVFSDEQVHGDVLTGAVEHVRERGKDRLRDRWSVLSTAFEDVDDVEMGDLFEEADDDTDSVDLDRPTCDTADGEHGPDWALAVHVAKALEYTPREIHQQAQGLFGAELPCSHGENCCSYTQGWDAVRDAENAPDLLVGSYVHAHVESVRTHYTTAGKETERQPRALVLDEYPGGAFVQEYDEKATDFAAWLARCLRDDVHDSTDMLQQNLWGDDWVRAWLEGRADEHGTVADATDALGRRAELIDAQEKAREILDQKDVGVLDSLGLTDALDAVATGDNPAGAYTELTGALDDVSRQHRAAGVAEYVAVTVHESLGSATDGGTNAPGGNVDADALPISGDLRELVKRAADASGNPDAVLGTLRAAVTALTGGRDGCRRLAAWANDGYAHPKAHHLLHAAVAPTEPKGAADSMGESAEGVRISTSAWAFDDAATDGTVLDVVDTGKRGRCVRDRNHHGALLKLPPSRTAGDGSEVPVVGLDATGREALWEQALGEPVDTADIFADDAERRAFLRDTLGLRVIRAADRARPYEGDPESKDTDGDVALLEELADEYSGLQAPRQRGGVPTAVGKPAAITSKGVRNVLESDSRLDGVVSAWEHFGNITGSNDLGNHRLAAILGSPHYGDHIVEKFCALAGVEADTDRAGGRGAELDYGTELANTYLKHMREDQVMQSALRFTRGDSGATVVARTSALRPDLPVVGRGQVVETWSDTATTIARQYRRLGTEFTIADVVDAVDVGKRQVRRVLTELAEAGYLERVSAGDGVATVYDHGTQPGAGEVDLPERPEAATPGQSASSNYYTWNVRVEGLDDGTNGGELPIPGRPVGAPPAPTPPDGGEPLT